MGGKDGRPRHTRRIREWKRFDFGGEEKFGFNVGMNWKDIPVWLRWLVVIAVANFIAFLVISGFAGGDGLNGRVDGDKYFVGSHGRFTAVSQRFYSYSRVHAFSVIVTHSLAIAGGLWVVLRRRKKV